MLNERIRALRCARGWSQVDLAKRLCVTKQSVSNWENDNILPSIEMLVKLAREFNVTTDYLLGLDSKRYVEIDGLDDDELAHVQQLVNDILKYKKKNAPRDLRQESE